MKNVLDFLLGLVLVSSAMAQPGASSSAKALPAEPPSDYQVVERAPHHRVWSRVVWVTNALDEIHSEVHSYTALETGMHRLRDGE